MSTSGLDGVYRRFDRYLPEYSTHANRLRELFEKAYIQRDNYGDASRFLVHQLFREYGLLIVDGDDIELKASFKAQLKQEVLKQPLKSAVERTNSRLKKHYKIQAHVRPINLFYLQDNARHRLIQEGEDYIVDSTNIRFSAKEISREIDQHPDRFSPNVLFRPLYQEHILPNIAYVGGGGEVAYWLQLKAAFKAFDIPYPVVLLRNSLLWLDEEQSRYFRDLELKFTDLFKEKGKLNKDWIIRQSGDTLRLEKEQRAFEVLYRRLAQKAEEVDESLGPHVEALEIEHYRSIRKLSEKLIRAERLRQTAASRKIDFLRNTLFPFKKLQERHDNFSEAYMVYGQEFIAYLIEEFEMPVKGFDIVLVEEGGDGEKTQDLRL